MKFAGQGSSPLPCATRRKFCGQKSAGFLQDFETFLSANYLQGLKMFF
jgi:hypothetical protein